MRRAQGQGQGFEVGVCIPASGCFGTVARGALSSLEARESVCTACWNLHAVRFAHLSASRCGEGSPHAVTAERAWVSKDNTGTRPNLAYNTSNQAPGTYDMSEQS